MVVSPPIAPLVYLINVLCKSLSFPCTPVFEGPEIVYDHSQDILVDGLGRSNFSTGDQDYFDVGSAPEPNLVETGYGIVEGYYMTTSGGRRIGAWEGIKYGRAHRWESPTQVRPWKGVAQAKSPGSDCLQMDIESMLVTHGSEDCLFLNVYSPVISGNKRAAKLPVIVYIHYGAFLFGSGSRHGPSYLLNQDVLLVNLNYRLGVLGFMSTGDDVLPGNWGMKDQVLALKWIQNNIAQFGGDPERVTLMGMSSGGASVHMHMMSPGSRGLFSKAISISGTAFNEWALQSPERARNFTLQIGEYFSCPTQNGRSLDLVNCLRAIDPISLVAAQIHLFKWLPFPTTFFAPTIEEPGGDGVSPFLTEWPTQLYKKGEVAPIPWIASGGEHEGLLGVLGMKELRRWSLTRRHWYEVAKTVLDLEYLELRNLTQTVNKITRYYFGSKKPVDGTELEYANMMTDRFFHFGVVTGIQAHSELAPTYAYLNTFGGPSRIRDIKKTPKDWGAGHGEDGQFYFNSSIAFPGLRRSDPEYKLSKIMLNFITNFVSNGTPTLTLSTKEDKTGRSAVVWEPVVDPRNLRFLLVGRNPPKMVTPVFRRIKFLDSLHLPDARLWVPL